MMWFSAGLPLLLQLLVPVSLLTAVALGGRTGRTGIALVVFAACYIVAIGVAGLWLVLPWWVPWLYGAVLLVAVTLTSRRIAGVDASTSSPLNAPLLAVSVAGAIIAISVTLIALLGRRAPATTVDVAIPFRTGAYLVVNGGMAPLINAHLATLEGEAFRPYRGQSYGVDLVAVDRLGLRARGVIPRDPSAYAIFGTPVVAPCAGEVIVAFDGVPDMPPPQPDRSHMAGNHVLLDCGGPWVLLGHFQRGSVAVRVGQRVAVGDSIGRVGNSGNSGEPHLHIHAQRPGTPDRPLSGDPLAVRVGGRFLARNHRVKAR